MCFIHISVQLTGASGAAKPDWDATIIKLKCLAPFPLAVS